METIIKTISENFSKGNLEFAYPHFDDEIQWIIVGAPAVKGKENVIAHCDKMLTEMAGSTLNNTHYIIGDDAIAVQGYCDYTSQEGAPGKVEYCDVYRFKNEKMVEITSYCIEIKMS